MHNCLLWQRPLRNEIFSRKILTRHEIAHWAVSRKTDIAYAVEAQLALFCIVQQSMTQSMTRDFSTLELNETLSAGPNRCEQVALASTAY